MKKDITIRITGEAGQGMQTIGMALCQLFKKRGLHLFANHDYMSRIRGGNNFFQLRVSDTPLFALRRNCDYIVALDAVSAAVHKKELTQGGVLVLDKKKYAITEENELFFDVPMHEFAQSAGGSELFVSSVALGVLAELLAFDFKEAQEVLRDAFGDKTEEVVSKNMAAAKAAFDFTRLNFKKNRPSLGVGQKTETVLLNGNDAIALGAIAAGCKFYSAYPMSPSTGIMNVVAHFAHDYNIVVEQAEDEIAAVNMIIGASFAGVRSMTATSGGGFALMAEGVSLAAMTETPIVVAEAQRPAPATGFPTRTEQSDLEFVLHAGHGEFARAIFTPGSIEEAFRLTVKAFDVAERFQIPVFILTDQHLADSYRDVYAPQAVVKNQRYIITREASKEIKEYKRYLLTDSGVSPRAIPSWIEDAIYADSDEHTEEGHITEDGAVRIAMVNKRFHQKMQGLASEVEKPVALNTEGADLLLVGFGSTFGVLKEISQSYQEKKIGIVHLPQIWPFPKKEIMELLGRAQKILTVENNAGAQLARLIRRETGITANDSILKFDGRPFDLDYLRAALGKAL